MKLRQYELDDNKWDIAKQLLKVLKVCPTSLSLLLSFTNMKKIFKDATLYFSWDRTLNIATVIPAMDHIDSILATTTLEDNDYPFSIRAALTISKKTLNRYYSKTDYSDIYHITMSMSRLSLIFYS